MLDKDKIEDFRAEDLLDFSRYFSAGGNLNFAREGSSLLISLASGDTISVSGSQAGLDIAEAQLLAITDPAVA